MGDYVWFHDVSWHASYAIYFFVIGILAGLSFLSYGSWITPALRVSGGTHGLDLCQAHGI